jgi:lipopolysaccharide export system protein LptC
MKLQTFTPKGAVDFSIDLPECNMNLVTGELTSEKPVEIRTTDFSLRSSSIRFDTQQKKGELRGKVRMEIFGDLLQPVSTPVESKKETIPKI